MDSPTRKTSYVRPPTKNISVGPDDVPLLPIPVGKAEIQRTADVKRRLLYIKKYCLQTVDTVDVAMTLLERGVTLPDLAEAIGLPPAIKRASKPLRPWRIQPDTNMAVIADMLEAAGRAGVSETEMMARLRDLGRLRDADMPLKAVHWTVTELQRRTKFLERRSRTDGARWFAYGRFDIWRGDRAQNS